MIARINECVECPPEMGCMGDSCPYRNILECTCDRCGEEIDEMTGYEYNGLQLCEECLLDAMVKDGLITPVSVEGE